MNKYMAKIIASIALFVLSLVFIIVGIVEVSPTNSNGGNKNDYTTTSITVNNTYNISANKKYQISSGSNYTLKITVYGTTSTKTNTPSVQKSGSSISVKYFDYEVYSNYIVYEYSVSSYSTYLISFTNIGNSSTAKFKTSLSY